VWAEAELVYDPPVPEDKEGDTVKATALALGAAIGAARREVLVESAYFILGDEQLERLAGLRGRGIRVAALTNSLATNDLTTNHSGYARRRKAMLDAGLELYELRPDAAACAVWVAGREDCGTATVSLHAKSAVFDRRIVYIGSFNINLRSIYLNSETVLLIHSPALAGQVADALELAMAPANSWRVSRQPEGSIRWLADDGHVWTHEPATGFWHRVTSRLFRMVPAEKYL
jgi:putative cardiolipin synthase